MTELLPKPVPDAGPPDGPSGRQIRVVLCGGTLGAVLLAAALVIDFSGANDVSVPQMPKMPALPTSLPSGLPTGIPTGFPTDLPSDFPTNLPTGFPELPTDLPTDLPGTPSSSGGGS
ncbi:PT domain-containing protein [Streptomyces xanthochromogenes]|uniref:PT domain-containing protein n=1 Tax=Streptomyces xanthochromogenes TaxID=67384 RepID=UPI001E46AC49|nr:PT domain-containing protein [Streptomyces xanthochromogenes]